MPTFYSQSSGREVRFDEVNPVHLINAVRRSGDVGLLAKAVTYLRQLRDAGEIEHPVTLEKVEAFIN